MMFLPRQMDNALSVPQYLPGEPNERQPEERELALSPSSSKNNSEEKQKKPGPLMIKGELIALTGDPRTAAILGQLLYWSQQINDFDLFLEEEKNLSSKSHVFQHGWFCKSALALMEETMIRVTLATFRRYLSFLIDRGWVLTRRNSQNKWTGGRQYRVNLRKLSHDLQKKGYSLPGFVAYGIFPSSEQNICEQEDDSSKGRNM